MREAYAEFTKCGGQVKSDGVLTVKAITAHGHREIIDMDVAPGEEKAIWSAIFDDFLDRGLDPQSVHLVVSDEHRGLKMALRRYFPEAILRQAQDRFGRDARTSTSATRVPKCLEGHETKPKAN